MAAIGTIAAGAAGIVGSLRQGSMNASMAEFNADVAHQNAITVEQQATENARRSLIQSNKMIGSQKAGFAASGISGGSALDVLEDTASKGELDALTIKNKGDISAAAYANEERLSQYRGSNAKLSGYIGAVDSAGTSAAKLLGPK